MYTISNVNSMLRENGYKEINFIPNGYAYLKETADYNKVIVVIYNHAKTVLRAESNITYYYNMVANKVKKYNSKECRFLSVIFCNSKKDIIKTRMNNVIQIGNDCNERMTKITDEFKVEANCLAEKREVKVKTDKLRIFNSNKAVYKTDNPIVNVILIIICGLVAVFASQYMERFALGPKQINDGKYYTLLTYAFFHNGKAHFLGNMITLIICGTALEKRLGNLKYIIFVLFTTAYAGTVSILYDIYYGNMDNLTVGISGTEYAMMAALCVYMIYQKQRGSILLMAYIVFEIFKCFADTQINNICHIGGAIGGVLVALIFVISEIIQGRKYLCDVYEAREKEAKRKGIIV